MTLYDHADLTQHQKRSVLREMRGLEINELERKKAVHKAKYESLVIRQEALTEVLEWAKAEAKLERAVTSRLHYLLDDIRRGRVFWGSPDSEDKDNVVSSVWATVNLLETQTFVIQHDWAGALSGAGDFDAGEFHLPADPVVFEMRLSGRHTIVLIGNDPNTSLEFGYFVETKHGWVARGPEPCDLSLVNDDHIFAWSQIRAVCIALDAEVASTETIRAPHKLNHAREKRGALPIRDYHVVNLANCSRAISLGVSDETRRKVRLHFRRGHWRHFVNHKTWIKWTLVGDPDLGFIDKEYRV